MRHRRRGEAQVEYAIIGIVVTSCAVTGLLVAGAGGLRRVADASQLCVVEAGECEKVESGDHGPPTPGEDTEQPDGADEEDAEAQDADADAESADEPSPQGTDEDELLGPRVEKLNPDGTIKDGSEPTEAELPQLGPLTLTPPPPAVDPFGLKALFSSALNTGYGQSLYQGFKGIFGLFR